MKSGLQAFRMDSDEPMYASEELRTTRRTVSREESLRTMSGISGLAADAVPLSSLSCTDCGFNARRPDSARTRRPCVVGAAEYGWSSTAATRSHTPSVRSGKRSAIIEDCSRSARCLPAPSSRGCVQVTTHCALYATLRPTQRARHRHLWSAECP